MKNLKRMVLTSLVGASVAASSVLAGDCQVKLTTSAYVNWNAINAAKNIGLFDKIEKDNKCELKITYYPDYLQSLNAYVAGQQDAVTVTNLDHMTAIAPYPGIGVVLQDYSNGNDGLISRNGKTLKDIKGQEVWMVTKSISELLFVEAAKAEGLDPYVDFKIQHMDMDSNLRAGYDAGTIDNIVTWNPALGYLTSQTKTKKTIVDSSKFPGLIVDTIVLNPTTSDFETKAKLLREAWDLTAELINKKSGVKYTNFIQALAEDMGSTTKDAKDMLAGSKVFTPTEELEFYQSKMASMQETTYKVAMENEFFMTEKPISFLVSGHKGGDLSVEIPNVKYFIK